MDGSFDINRRRLLAAAGIAAALPAAATVPARRWTSEPSVSGAPAVAGLHLQFGEDATSQIVVSWHALESVQRPQVVLGHPDGTLLRTVDAVERSYVDAKSGQRVHAFHARLDTLTPDTEYMYAAVHDGAGPEFGNFRTAPRGRATFTFTSFGDQGTPTLGRRFVPPAGVVLPNAPFVNDNLGGPAGADTTTGIERIRPLFHLFNGDLCYANLAQDRVRAWSDFWTNNSRSARNRPWMPSAGNHENELGNGPIGYRAYQTYFELPSAPGQDETTRGLWYAFTVGSVRVVSIANDDVCYQDGGDSYVRGYSAGRQKAWLESTLRAARADRAIDWIVICMHQVAISTADKFNVADLGVREEWLPLFDRFGVDLVVCGHEHHYERSHPIRGAEANPTRTPVPRGTALDVIDTTQGTVHMVIGGGGTSIPSNELLFEPPRCRVITAVQAPDPTTGKRRPVYVVEPAPWSASRNAAHAYGFAAFEVRPDAADGMTEIKVTYYDVLQPNGALQAFESFFLRRPRR